MSLELKINPEEVSNRRERISSNVEEFKVKLDNRFKDSESRESVSKALNLMLDAHLSQKDRADGTPYASHPLEVAQNVMNITKEDNADLVSAALLHDVVEDKSEVLFTKRVNKKFPDRDFMFEVSDQLKEKYSDIFKRFSFKELKDNFGDKVEYYVNNLTNHDFDSFIEDAIPDASKEDKQKLKNILYAEHVEKIIKDPDLCLLKYADFSANIDLRSLPKDGDKYKKLRRKYKSVIPVFIKQLDDIPKEHSLYNRKDELIKNLEKIYKEQYQD